MKNNTLTVTNYQERVNLVSKEHEVLDYWDETKSFEQSIKNRPEDKRYVFYDGPPFATGTPHYGHILASTIKDVVPRYWTMKGYRVDRVWGWDCHGIPIENMIEKELGLKGGKKGIEEMGIDKFNAACRSAIFRFDKDWETVIRRIGRWVDFKHSYKTMDKTYMESVWWAFKELYDKGHVYEGRKVILYCPRCATPLSNFEIAMDNSYKDVEDNSSYIKFKVKGKENEYFMAWTTTPWTLIGNVALAVKKDATYVLVKHNGQLFWVAKDRYSALFTSENEIQKTVKGKDLVGIEYEPLYDYMPLDGKKAHYMAEADFVSLEDGTGIVHTAAIFGEDDYKLAVALDLPRVPTLDDQGKFLSFVTPLAGIFYKKAEDWVLKDLLSRDLLFKSEKFVHSYPFCYRCETPLYYNAIPAWFINVQELKPKLIDQNEHIHWYPDYLKYGRFGKGLETAPDWNISRSRYWGTPMPIWRAEVSDPSTNEKKMMLRIIGSLEELQKWAVNPQQVAQLTDIHREFLDDIDVWIDDAKTIKGKRLPEVFDCWVESGSMPYASIHYPFEHKKEFEETHPAQFIAEYIAQTRAWFYTVHVMSVGLFGTHTFENAVTTGTILAEDGAKMSKSKKNYPDPAIMFEKYGVDALRFYLMGSVVMKAENLNFSEKSVAEVYQRVISLLWNTFSFYKLYSAGITPELTTLTHDLDRWIVSRTNRLICDVTDAMDSYDTVTSCRLITEYSDDLSTWYLRRSRERFKKNPESMAVFGWVLERLVRVIAPFMPFVSELMYQNLNPKRDSVHLEDWPTADRFAIDKKLEDVVSISRTIVEGLHALRKKHNLAVKQALGYWSYDAKEKNIIIDYPGVLHSIEEEVNVRVFIPSDERSAKLLKKSTVDSMVVLHKIIGDIEVDLDTEVTPELELERRGRELIRAIQTLRKESGCSVTEEIVVELPKEYADLPTTLLDTIQKETVVSKIVWGETLRRLTL
jgi:isoleucyl-tRNA synthetase